MKTKLLVILTLSVIILTFASCGNGITQTEYDKVQKLVVSQNATIQGLQAQLSQAKTPTYFENRTAIENWLKTVKKLGVSKDPEQWLQFALYYQKKALDVGYILSVSYTFSVDKSINVTCDIVSEDGWVYYFNPDDLELKDTRIRVDMLTPSEVEASATGVYQ